jgi:polysaccharide chain length determinant protein (PEP-CTERM system associated)
MTQRELTPADYLAMFRRRWVLIAILAIVGPPMAYAISLALPSQYKSQTLVLVQPQTVSEQIVPSFDTTGVNEHLASMQQQILSRSRLEPIIRQFGLYPKDINRVSIDDLVGRLQKAIEVTPVAPMAETRSSNLPGFFVNVTLDSPQNAQHVCAAITSMFIEQSISEGRNNTQGTNDFLAQQLEDARTLLNQKDAALAAFEVRYSGSLPSDEQANLNMLTNLTSQLDAATQALARAQQDKGFAESQLTQQIQAWQATQSGRNPDTLEQQLAILQTQLASLEARYTEDYPDVIKTKNDIVVLKQRIAENGDSKAATGDKPQGSLAEPASITQLRAQVHSAELAIAEKTKEQEQTKQEIRLYQGRVQSSPLVEQQYKELTRGYQTALDSFNDLQKKLQASTMASDLANRSQGEQFRVLDPANLPTKPNFPNRPLFALGGLAGGLGLGLGLAFLLEMRDTSMRTERDVEFVLRLPVLAMVPEIAPLTAKSQSQVGALKDARSGLGLGSGA